MSCGLSGLLGEVAASTCGNRCGAGKRREKNGKIEKIFIPDAAAGYGDRIGYRVLKCKLRAMYVEGNR